MSLEQALQRWRRRYWRPDALTASYAGLTPVTVVTGGSEGIGRALAEEFARHGHRLLLVARDGAALAEAATSLAVTGVVVDTLAADLATEAGCAGVEARLAELGACCDVLVNNAAVGLGGPLAGQPLASLRQLIDLNAAGLTDLTRRFLPGMLSRGRGGVLNVASLGGLTAGPYEAAYYASKAYVVSLTEALAHETAGHGVRVCVLLPGPVATKFHARMGSEHSYYLSLMGVMTPERVARIAYWGFWWGHVLIYSGAVHQFYAIALRVLPHWLMIPVMGWMLRRNQAD